MHNNAVRQGGFFGYSSSGKWIALKSVQYFGSSSKTAIYVSYIFQESVRMQSLPYACSPEDKQAFYIEKLSA
jgi:hypothetical protein